jgi:hypothetical protein
MWERFAFKWCEDNPDIKSWSSEETVIPYISAIDNKYHRYFVDLKLNMKDGRTIIVEIKPDKQTKPPSSRRRTKKHIRESLEYVKNQCKWNAAVKYCKDNGYEFQIWTEHTLKQMGMKF